MSKPPDNLINLSETLSLCEFKSGGNKGFWLYDETRGMNLAMCAKSETDAFVAALEYYQKRLLTVEQAYSTLKTKVDKFISQVTEEE
jgi:hypothetical protein